MFTGVETTSFKKSPTPSFEALAIVDKSDSINFICEPGALDSPSLLI